MPNSREAVARAGLAKEDLAKEDLAKEDLAKEDLAKEDLAKEDLAKKGAARGCKRPKSREETPKEGSGNAMRYRTATTWPRIAQKASEIDLLFIPISHGWAALGRGRGEPPYCGVLPAVSKTKAYPGSIPRGRAGLAAGARHQAKDLR